MRQLLITIAGAILFATAAVAQTQIDRFDIAINAEDEGTQANLVSLGTTFALLAPRTSGVRKASRLEFHSGSGLIDGAAATQKLQSAMPPALATSLVRRGAMTGPCDISRHRFEDTDVLIAVHDSAGAQPEDPHRCFVAALWIYHAGVSEPLSVGAWRAPYARILGSLANGRPAFSGFVIEEE